MENDGYTPPSDYIAITEQIKNLKNDHSFKINPEDQFAAMSTHS